MIGSLGLGARRRPSPVAAFLALAVVVAACGGMIPSGDPAASGEGAVSSGALLPDDPTPEPTPIPDPQHEVYGFVPYWEMDASIVDHVKRTDLTTLALFSVTHRRSGAMATNQNGYKRIIGDVGQGVLRDRRVLAEEGVVVVVVTVDVKTGAILVGPEVITRGWVYAPEAEPLLTECADVVRLAVKEGIATGATDIEQLQKVVRRAAGRFVNESTRRRPMIVPVVTEA